MSTQTQKDGEFRNGMPFVGGRHWLDLLNTTPFDGTTRQDLIATGEGLRLWIDGADMEKAANKDEDPARITAFRETLRAAVDLMRLGAPVPQTVVDAVNTRLADVRLSYRLETEGGSPVLAQFFDTGRAGLAGAIAADFARFVCDHEPGRLKRCSNPACTMVFYDVGKNNTRRWCTMSICGNRDKVARYRAHRANAVKTTVDRRDEPL